MCFIRTKGLLQSIIEVGASAGRGGKPIEQLAMSSLQYSSFLGLGFSPK